MVHSVHIYEYLLCGRECISVLPVSLLGLEIGDRSHPVRHRETIEQLKESNKCFRRENTIYSEVAWDGGVVERLRFGGEGWSQRVWRK